MSKYNLEKALKKELRVLNEIIDKKIVLGLSYSREAKRHKFILSNLLKIRRQSQYSWLPSFSVI